jgi:hypothetical protein
VSNTAVQNHDLDDEDLELQDGETESELVRRLRSTIKNQTKELKELRPLKAEVAEVRLDSSFKSAFEKEELEGLSEAKRKALLGIVGDDQSPEALRKAAAELGFVETKVDPVEEELAGHERVENAGNGAGAAAAGKIDPDVVAGWSMEKKLQFRDQHPDAWEQIKRGEPVHGIAF